MNKWAGMLQPLNRNWATASTYPTLLLKVVVGELLHKIIMRLIFWVHGPTSCQGTCSQLQLWWKQGPKRKKFFMFTSPRKGTWWSYLVAVKGNIPKAKGLTINFHWLQHIPGWFSESHTCRNMHQLHLRPPGSSHRWQWFHQPIAQWWSPRTMPGAKRAPENRIFETICSMKP